MFQNSTRIPPFKPKIIIKLIFRKILKLPKKYISPFLYEGIKILACFHHPWLNKSDLIELVEILEDQGPHTITMSALSQK